MTDSEPEGGPSIQFVYFDLGNILVRFDEQIACANASNLFDVAAEKIHAAVYGSGQQTRYEHGELSGEEFATSIREQVGRTIQQMPTQRLLDALSDMFTPIDSMQQIVHSVHQAGVPFGILSNTCAAHWDWITRQQWPVMQEAYRETILSFEAGAMKPNKRIYQLAEASAEVARERILFVDDRTENVQAAKQRGWQAVECIGGEPVAAVLREYGVTA
tara:strand:- start:26228 stop:26878 length:651 start_codon:yes stop_codon:yes gene_type:complete